MGSIIANAIQNEEDSGRNSIRPCGSRLSSGDNNDVSEASELSYNSSNDALYPPGNTRYIAKPRDGKDSIEISLDSAVVHEKTVTAYEKIRVGLPRCTSEPLFNTKASSCSTMLKSVPVVLNLRATGFPAGTVRMDWAIDYDGISAELLVSVPSEKTVIDQRGLGNSVGKVNHHCEKNSFLNKFGLERELWHARWYFW